MRYLFIFTIVSLFSIISCKKKDLNKTPVQLKIRTDFVGERTNGNTNFLRYDNLKLRISELRFVAEQVDGEPIEFIRTFEQPLYLDFSQNDLVSQLEFALPARAYESIDLYFELDNDQQAGLVLEGSFSDQGNDEAVLIAFNTVDELHVKGRQNELENEEISFTNLTEIEGRLTLNPAFWTRTFSKQNLIMADRQLVDNEMTIFIDEQNNQQLFQTIINRVDLKNYLEF
jgi:hypothetical protein